MLAAAQHDRPLISPERKLNGVQPQDSTEVQQWCLAKPFAATQHNW
jgi:hypothetical protein